MDYTLLLLIFSFFWSYVVSKHCKTPFGKVSKCVSVYDCPELLPALQKLPIPNDVKRFLRQSHCGRNQEGFPEVCCGPLPTKQAYPSVVQKDPTIAKDSFLAPRDQCGVDRDGNRIYGGNATELDEYPWMAMLGYLNSTGTVTYQCGGMLLNNRYVLTAAHCLIGEILVKYGKLVTVRLGEYDTRTDIDCIDGVCADPPQEIPVLAAYPHKEGNNEKNSYTKNDIGLIKLTRRAIYSYFVLPICLVNSGTRLAEGTDVVVVGWGKTLTGKKSPVKIKLHMPIFNKKICDSIFRTRNRTVTNNQICAGGVFAEDSCLGDSGGPLMIRRPEGIWEAVGVVSYGIGCGFEGRPGIYTSIAHYLDWIQSTMRSTNQ